MTRQEIAAQVLDFLAREAGPDARFEADTPLLQGALDSLALVRLLAFILRTYGIRVANQEVLPKHFGSVSALSGFIAGRLAEQGA